MKRTTAHIQELHAIMTIQTCSEHLMMVGQVFSVHWANRALLSGSLMQIHAALEGLVVARLVRAQAQQSCDISNTTAETWERHGRVGLSPARELDMRRRDNERRIHAMWVHVGMQHTNMNPHGPAHVLGHEHVALPARRL